MNSRLLLNETYSKQLLEELNFVISSLIHSFGLSTIDKPRKGSKYETAEINVDSADLQAFPFATVDHNGNLKFDAFPEEIVKALQALINRNLASYNSEAFVKSTYSKRKNAYNFDLLLILRAIVENNPELIETYISEILVDPKTGKGILIENRSDAAAVEMLRENPNAVYVKRLHFEAPFNGEIAVLPLFQLSIEIRQFIKNRKANPKNISLFFQILREYGVEGAVISFGLAGFDHDAIWALINALHAVNDEKKYTEKDERISKLPRYGTYYVNTRAGKISKNNMIDPIAYITKDINNVSIQSALIDNSTKKFVDELLSKYLRVQGNAEDKLRDWHLTQSDIDKREEIYSRLTTKKRILFRGKIKGAFKSLSDAFHSMTSSKGINPPLTDRISAEEGFDGIALTEEASMYMEGEAIDEYPLLNEIFSKNHSEG